MDKTKSITFQTFALLNEDCDIAVCDKYGEKIGDARELCGPMQNIEVHYFNGQLCINEAEIINGKYASHKIVVENPVTLED